MSRTATASVRLDAIDFFRGLALTFVLLDHCDWPAGREVFRQWTPIGLGFFDGADVFVFLSGLTFGWVYSRRLERDGFRQSAVRIVRRVVEIYLGYAACVLIVTAFSLAPFEMLEFSRDPLRLRADESLTAALAEALTFRRFPFGLGILALYVVILPAMLSLLALARRSARSVLAVSTAAYVVAQPLPGSFAAGSTWLAHWGFHPLAWQFLFVLGMLNGDRLWRRRAVMHRHILPAALAAAVLLYGLIAAKRELLAQWFGGSPEFWQWFDLSQNWLISKPRLGPLRMLHFAAAAYLVAWWLPERTTWTSGWRRPFINAGRHSLTLYCCGTLLVFATAVPYYWFGNSVAVVLMIGLDACAVQFVLAWWLEGRGRGAEEQRSKGEG